MPRYQNRANPRLDLGAAFQEYIADQRNYIGIRALTILPVEFQSAAFASIQRASWMKVASAERAPGADYRRIDFTASDKTYNCKERALEYALDDGQLARFARDFDSEFLGLQFLMDALLRAQEVRIAALLQDPAVWSGSDYFTDVSLSAPWSNPASDIKGTVNTARQKVRNLTGMEVNAVILSAKNRDNILNNDDFRSEFAYTAFPAQDALEGAMAAWLGVEKVLASRAVVNALDEGQTGNAVSAFSDTYVSVAVVAPEGSTMIEWPCVGRTFLWTGDTPENVTVETYRDESRRSTVYRVRQFVDEVIIDKAYAHLLKVA